MTTQEAKQRNLERIDEYFHVMLTKLQSQRDEVKNSLVNLRPEEREEIAIFWEGMAVVLNDVAVLIRDMFQEILRKMKRGYQFQFLKETAKMFLGELRKLIIEDLAKVVVEAVFDAMSN